MSRYEHRKKSRWSDFIQGRLTGDYRSGASGGSHKIHLGRTRDGEKVGYSPIENDTLRMMIVGPSGAGKTRLMDDICRQVITDKERPSLVVIDPKSTQDLYRSVLKFSLDRGLEDRLYFLDPSYEYLPGYNMMEPKNVPAYVQVADMLSARMKAWGEEDEKMPMLRTWSKRTDRALIDAGLTLNEAKYMVDTGKNEYRRPILAKVEKEELVRKWENLLTLKSIERDRKLGVVERRMEDFLIPDPVRTMVSQKENYLKLDEIFDRGDILLITLPQKSLIPKREAKVLRRLLVNDIINAAARRPQKNLRPIYLVIDEFSQIVSKDVGEILDLGRSKNLNFIFGHQHLHQVSEKDLSVFYSELTNTNVQAVFGGLTREDLEVMADEFYLQEYDPKRVKEERYRTFFEPVDEEVTEETRRSHRSQSRSETTKEREDGEEEVVKREGSESREEINRTTRQATTHKERKELANRQFYSLQEQQLLAEQELRKPAQQWLHVSVNKGKPALIKAPDCYELELPSRRIEAGKEKIVDAKEVYSSREDVEKEVEEREKKLKRGGGEEKEEPENFTCKNTTRRGSRTKYKGRFTSRRIRKLLRRPEGPIGAKAEARQQRSGRTGRKKS